MNSKIKAKWVAALRSGEFKQGRFKLFNPVKNKYCCLGVLAVQLRATHDKAGNLCWNNKIIRDETGASYLPQSLLNEVGLSQYKATELAVMNDSRDSKRYNFKDIANYIEKYL